MNNSIKWIIISLSVVVITVVLLIGVVPKLRSSKPKIKQPVHQQVASNATVDVNPDLLSTNEQMLQVNFVNEFQGYRITGISVEKNNSVVYLEKDQSTQEYRIGDVVIGNFFINDIHWAHIILTDNNTIVHLNNTN